MMMFSYPALSSSWIQCSPFFIAVHHHESSSTVPARRPSPSTTSNTHHNNHYEAETEAEGSGGGYGGCGSYSDDEDCNYYDSEDDYYYNYDEGSGSGEPEQQPPKTTSKPKEADKSEDENWPPWVTARPELNNQDITVDEQQYPRTATGPLKPKEPSFSGAHSYVRANLGLLSLPVLIFILLWNTPIPQNFSYPLKVSPLVL